jgi:hypothetical protein
MGMAGVVGFVIAKRTSDNATKAEYLTVALPKRRIALGSRSTFRNPERMIRNPAMFHTMHLSIQ